MGTMDQAVNRKDELVKKADAERRAAAASIYSVFRSADADGDGKLTKDELVAALELSNVVEYIHEVGIDARQAENLFDILDYDESGYLDAREFVEGMLKVRGEAKAKD